MLAIDQERGEDHVWLVDLSRVRKRNRGEFRACDHELNWSDRAASPCDPSWCDDRNTASALNFARSRLGSIGLGGPCRRLCCYTSEAKVSYIWLLGVHLYIHFSMIVLYISTLTLYNIWLSLVIDFFSNFHIHETFSSFWMILVFEWTRGAEGYLWREGGRGQWHTS